MSKLDDLIAEHGITCDAAYVPWDGEDRPRLSWEVTLKIRGREFLQCGFSAGIGHAPSYPAECAEEECRTGKRYSTCLPINPNLRDVVWSVAMDAQALDYPTFEDWAGDLGLDTDSRKAEAMYRECISNAIALRAGLGPDVFEQLLETAREE